MSPPNRPYSHHDDARFLTAELRTSDHALWAAVRQHLTDAGLDPLRSAVGDLFPEDIGEFGVLVASNRSTHTFMVGTESIRGERGKKRWWVTNDERTTAESRFAYATAMFAAMMLLESEEATGVHPLDLLVEYLAVLTQRFRGHEKRRWDERRPENYWDVLYAFMAGRGIDPMKTIALDYGDNGVESEGGVLDPSNRCYYFVATMESLHGPTTEVTTWEELDSAAARSIYGELVDAGEELLRREGRGTT